jgi:quinol monooxygenase YgiN
MSEVRVIARSVARKGNEEELRALLQGMLVPTRAEQGCKSYELYESCQELLLRCGVKASDVVVSITENADEDWSFGYGRAQFITGEL